MHPIAEFLQNFTPSPISTRCMYVYGGSGTGKTTLVLKTLKNLGYDALYYSAVDVRNKNLLEHINLCNTTGINILSLFQKKKQKLVVVMDDIECMNTGDKSGLNALISLIRLKKTKKQKEDPSNLIPIICIGTTHTDKKMKELMKCCVTLHVPPPTPSDLLHLLREMLPSKPDIHPKLVAYADGDLHKLSAVCGYLHTTDVPFDTFQPKPPLADIKDLAKRIMNSPPLFNDHGFVNDTDRTILSLLWHENAADLLDALPRHKAVTAYAEVMEVLGSADYLDRLTFQRQIWQLSEMTSLLKTFHATTVLRKHTTKNVTDVRFTKVLTKFSSEHNNKVFMQRICQHLGLERRDVLIAFTKTKQPQELCAKFELSLVDVNRILRLVDAIL
jgi:ATPase family associated with various cellular activities (AAA)/Replication factor RFC1 C terminal domain